MVIVGRTRIVLAGHKSVESRLRLRASAQHQSQVGHGQRRAHRAAIVLRGRVRMTLPVSVTSWLSSIGPAMRTAGAVPCAINAVAQSTAPANAQRGSERKFAMVVFLCPFLGDNPRIMRKLPWKLNYAGKNFTFPGNRPSIPRPRAIIALHAPMGRVGNICAHRSRGGHVQGGLQFRIGLAHSAPLQDLEFEAESRIPVNSIVWRSKRDSLRRPQAANHVRRGRPGRLTPRLRLTRAAQRPVSPALVALAAPHSCAEKTSSSAAFPRDFPQTVRKFLVNWFL